jgi:hypothetical protein
VDIRELAQRGDPAGTKRLAACLARSYSLLRSPHAAPPVSQITLRSSHSSTRTRPPPVHCNGPEQKHTYRGELAQHIREVDHQHANDLTFNAGLGTAAVPDDSTAAPIAISRPGRPVPGYRDAIPPLSTPRTAVTTAISKISRHGSFPGTTGTAGMAFCWGQPGAVGCEGGTVARAGQWKREMIVDVE